MVTPKNLAELISTRGTCCSVLRRASLAIFLLLVFGGIDAHSQEVDTLISRKVWDGVIQRRLGIEEGPWSVNVLEIDLQHPDLEVESARALDRLRGRETTSSIAARKTGVKRRVVAALNADFFSLKTGENENNQITNGTFVKGVKIADSPHDRFNTSHSQFAISFDRRPLIDRFEFSGLILWNDGTRDDLSGVNYVPDEDALSIFNQYFGLTTPVAVERSVTEAQFLVLKKQADTTYCVVRGRLQTGGGSPLSQGVLVLAGYGKSQQKVQRKVAPDDTVKIVLGMEPHRGQIKALVGGWPRIVVEGENIAGRADSTEGTFPGFSAKRHPRSGVGFSRDSTTIYFVTVDGRQKSSVGMTLMEFADLMISLGVYQGLNLDGGGSTTLVIEGAVVNSPSDITGERPIGNCLLLYARMRDQW